MGYNPTQVICLLCVFFSQNSGKYFILIEWVNFLQNISNYFNHRFSTTNSSCLVFRYTKTPYFCNHVAMFTLPLYNGEQGGNDHLLTLSSEKDMKEAINNAAPQTLHAVTFLIHYGCVHWIVEVRNHWSWGSLWSKLNCISFANCAVCADITHSYRMRISSAACCGVSDFMLKKKIIPVKTFAAVVSMKSWTSL